MNILIGERGWIMAEGIRHRCVVMDVKDDFLWVKIEQPSDRTSWWLKVTPSEFTKEIQ